MHDSVVAVVSLPAMTKSDEWAAICASEMLASERASMIFVRKSALSDLEPNLLRFPTVSQCLISGMGR